MNPPSHPMKIIETNYTVPALKRAGLSTLALTLLSAAAALAVTCLLYKQAWQIPGLRDLRDNRLVFALWLLASPLVGAAFALARRATWSRAARACGFCLAAGLPVAAIGGGVQNIGTRSADKAILCNLRQLAAAADQYFLENGTSTVPRYEDLVGADKYVKAVNPVRGEDYRHNFPLHQGDTLTAEQGHGLAISYPPEGAPDRPASSGAAKRVTPMASDATTVADVATPIHVQDRPLRRGTMCASCHAHR